MKTLALILLLFSITHFTSAQETKNLNSVVQMVLDQQELLDIFHEEDCAGQYVLIWNHEDKWVENWDNEELKKLPWTPDLKGVFTFRNKQVVRGDGLNLGAQSCGVIKLSTEKLNNGYKVSGSLHEEFTNYEESDFQSALKFEARVKNSKSGLKIIRLKTKNLPKTGCWVWL
ncbi:MAG: hypothetical protein K9J17_03370 [Flavobacteriales bacterium]|nr:hypothetical protein [Flavobacteriales bacterium]